MCTALPTDSVSSFQRHLNSIDSHIQFTVEKESDHSVTFLDILLTHHKDGTISTFVHRKPSHMDRYLDFSSHHPMAHKVSVVRTHYVRARTLSSTPLQQLKEEKHVIQALKGNSYPTRLIQRKRNRFPHILWDAQESQRPVARITLPYIQHLSEAIKRMLRKLDPHDFPPTFYTTEAVSKTFVTKKSLSNVVYRIPCKDCDCNS